MIYRICLIVFLLVNVVAGYTQPVILSIRFNYQPSSFPISGQQGPAAICIDPGSAKVVHIAGAALQQDIKEITGSSPVLNNKLSSANGYAVIAGTIGQSPWIDKLAAGKKINIQSITGKWESFSISVVANPVGGIKQALVIAGSDARGTAFGIFELSKMMGVSPWAWWADVHPAPRKEIYVTPGVLQQGSPSVKYRGIFLNDEDWGLQPWAAKKMDPAVKDIGPNTYTKIFELLLRLKANYIWPAMHPCTKAFYYYRDNPKIANDYAIVVGSSHCEPMLRNNVFEWAENYEHEYGIKPGEWRYDKNKTQIYDYWSDRIAASKKYESVYTVGMRGIHDGSMPGPPSVPEKVKLLQQIIDDQRKLLHDSITKPLSDIPQIFCPYKEVLTVYRNGLQLPDDVTIVWSDDNHGYMRQLSNAQEQQRSGHSGVYYHLSYWGSPHDFLWLSSVSPALISYEMTRAYQRGADRLWVFNVGDIKPAEMELEFAMDMAWNVNQWQPAMATQYIEQWALRTFGPAYAQQITAIKKQYYELAQSAKPEHMGSVTFHEVEALSRLQQYKTISNQAQELYQQMPAYLKDACFELILYPVQCAMLMNEKIMYARQSLLSAKTDGKAAMRFAQRSASAFETIQSLTKKYNDSIAGGKWSGMMSWHPRDLPVFNMPKTADKKYIDSLAVVGATQPLARETSIPVVIPAAAYANKKDAGNFSITTIEGLGIHGNGLTVLPFSTTSNDSSVSNKPFVEYKVNMEQGEHAITVKCLPTQSISGNGLLRYAISVNNSQPQLVNIHTEAESRQWKENVLRGFAQGKTTCVAGKNDNMVRIYFIDAGLVINQLEVD
jgi:hypothetical protein